MDKYIFEIGKYSSVTDEKKCLCEVSGVSEKIFDLFSHHMAQMIRIMRDKNSDYSGSNDFFENFREAGLMGILVRMGDKMKRLKNLLLKGGKGAVKDETFEDTCLDLANYSLILLAAFQDDMSVGGESWDELFYKGDTEDNVKSSFDEIGITADKVMERIKNRK